jgi:acyl carrier protein
MNREELENKIRTIVADLLNIEESEITDDSHFINDLHADSLDSVELVMMAEDTFNISIKDDDAAKAITFKLLVDLVESKIED